jgi:hypothetical protein
MAQPEPPSRDEVRRLLGDIDDHLVAEILSSGVSVEELEAVAVHLALETDVGGDIETPMTVRGRLIYDAILRAEETPDR